MVALPHLRLARCAGLKVCTASGVTPSGAHHSLRFQLSQLQVDDQLAGAR